MARKSKRLLAVWYSRTHQDTAAVRADGLWVKCCILVFEHNTAGVPMVVIGCWSLRPWLPTIINTCAMVFRRIGQSVALLRCDAVVQQLSSTCQLHQRSCSGSVAGATCPSMEAAQAKIRLEKPCRTLKHPSSSCSWLLQHVNIVFILHPVIPLHF